MIRIQAPSRLHFGFLTLGSMEHWPDLEKYPARQFGGVGLMVRKPGVQLTVAPAPRWSAAGPLAERALAFARKLAGAMSTSVAQPQALTVERVPPEHIGLGTGTQLAMAVGRALTAAWKADSLGTATLARHLDRGARSSLGLHGFVQGGFLVECGKRQAGDLAPLVTRLDFPEAWRVLLVLPPWGKGLSGKEEHDAIRRLQNRDLPLAATEALCRIVLLGMLPALAERDWATFGEALYDFNARVGEVFSPVQGGRYAHPQSGELITFLRQLGVRGAGQSSWGPTVFAIARDETQALDLIPPIRKHFNLQTAQIVCTQASNAGAKLEILGDQTS
jgi:beta-RFAP synthase